MTDRRTPSAGFLKALFSLFLLAAIFPSPLPAQMGDFGSMGDMADASQFMQYIPPFIKDVWHEPEAPGVGDGITVYAEIFRLNLTPDSMEYVEEAYLEYSTDGGETWEEVEMYEVEDEANTWSGEIPALEEAGEVLYRIRAADSAGNMVLEKPYPIEEDAESLSDLELGLEIEDEDESDEQIPSYLNILSTGFDYDDDYYYFHQEFESKPDQGTISPIDANVYILAMINKFPEIDFTKFKMTKDHIESMAEEVGKDMAGHIAVWFYAPIADIAPPLPEIGKIPGVALIRLDEENIKRPIFGTDGFEYEIEDNSFNLRFERESMPGEPADMLMFVSFNIRIVGSDFSTAKPEKGDVSNSVVVYFRSHSVEVE
ncbi:MAG: hypothetical protein ABIH66_02305 [bacterium]